MERKKNSVQLTMFMLTLDGNKEFVVVSLGAVDDIDMVVVVVVML